MSAAPKLQQPEFGKTLVLSETHAAAALRAEACFAAIPQLEMLAVWTKPNESQESRFRLQHDRTWFWMERESEEEEDMLNLEDVTDDKAAGACFRFSYAHKNAAHHLAADYRIDDLVCVLIFHRSGNNYLVRDADYLFELTKDRLAELGAAFIAPLVHPVFGAEPSGHQLIAWADAVWRDLEELYQEG